MFKALTVLLTFVLKGLGVLLLIFAVYLGYGLWREPRAKAAAEAFCAATAIGESTDALQKRAQAAEPFMLLPKGKVQNELMVMFMGMPPYSRHLCKVSLRDGKVVQKDYQYLD